jgi:hypothetical protein
MAAFDDTVVLVDDERLREGLAAEPGRQPDTLFDGVH